MARQIICDLCERPIENSMAYEQRVKEYTDPSGLIIRVRITALTKARHDADLHRTCAEAIFAATLAAMRTGVEA